MENKLHESASQTAGPYVHIGCVPTFAGLENMYGGVDLGSKMINEHTLGERVVIEGLVYDGDEALVKDAMIEIWQADSNGLFNSPSETRGQADPNFTGWGRQPTNRETGVYSIETIKPGRVPWSDGQLQAPHLALWITARGINLGLHTRLYFSDEAEANAADPLLTEQGVAPRADTLIAKHDGDVYRFDVYLQGDKETVFFDI